MRELLDKTKLGEWMTIGQPISRSMAVMAPSVLALEHRKWLIDRSRADLAV